MINLIEKLHALLASDDVNVWHFPCATDVNKRFVYWLKGDREGKYFSSLDAMIWSAYAHIDPMEKPLPLTCPVPESSS